MLLLLVLVGLPFANAAPITRTFDVEPGGELVIDTDVGSIDVSPAEGSSVVVEVDVQGDGAEHFELDFRHRADGVRVRGKARRGIQSQRWGRVRVHFRVTVPPRYSVDLDTSGGSISVGDLEGEVKTDTSGGSIAVGRVSGPVRASTSGGGIDIEFSGSTAEADTSGGSIRIGEAVGRIEADTSGGSIRVGRAGGKVSADTSGGSINIREASGAVFASTSGGSIKVGFSSQPDAKSRIETSGGMVTVYVSEGLAFDVRARSGVGVDSELRLEDARMEPGRLEGVLNGGGPMLDLRSSGRVRILRM